ncbi:hypothetical protein E4U59_007151 [Claviceps monticola]|nr:hypothetical protein E4U59_007151 [Claviceps monticola]
MDFNRDKVRIIMWLSHKLGDAERRDSMPEKEMPAIDVGLKETKWLVDGSPYMLKVSTVIAHTENIDSMANLSEVHGKVARWISIRLDSDKETTSEFTRKNNPKNRYWKAGVRFVEDYAVARLQRGVGEKIVGAAAKQGGIVDMTDKRAVSDEDSWWLTVNNINGRSGCFDKDAVFSQVDLGKIFTKTQQGLKVNLDLVFSIRLTKSEADRTDDDVFNLVADCSRCAIKAMNVDVQAPLLETAILQQRAYRMNIAPTELIDQLNALEI